jgi:hypothetical protein
LGSDTDLVVAISTFSQRLLKDAEMFSFVLSLMGLAGDFSSLSVKLTNLGGSPLLLHFDSIKRECMESLFARDDTVPEDFVRTLTATFPVLPTAVDDLTEGLLLILP